VAAAATEGERAVVKAGRPGRGFLSAPLFLPLLAILCFALHGREEWIASLELDRAALAAGELWRLFTAHLTHYSLEHLVLDVLAFLVLGIACESREPRRARWTLAASALVISVGVLLLDPGMQRYRGLSGLDSALFALLFTSLLRDHDRRGKARLLLWIPGLLFLAKIGYEAVMGTAVFLDSSAAGFAPAPLAHLLGAACGLVLGWAPSHSLHAGRPGEQRCGNCPSPS
jgi:rhomboid family GlyGly-CTERM serine protease